MNLEQKAQVIANSISTLLHIKCEVRPEDSQDTKDTGEHQAFLIEPQKTLSYGAIMGAVFLKYQADMRPVRQNVKYGNRLIFRNVLKRLNAKIYCVCDRFGFVTDILVEDASARDLKPSVVQNVASRLIAARESSSEGEC